MSGPDPIVSLPIRFRSFEEIKARPAWRDSLDPAQHTLSRIIGDYSFSRKNALPCGLKTCRTVHQNGYVVETADGLETHIGNRCGKRYFGINWGDLQSAFARASEERDNAEWLDGLLSRRDQLLGRANHVFDAITNQTAGLREVVERLRKEPVLYQALERVFRAGGAIQLERRIDQATIERMELSESQHTYLETVGRVQGLEVAMIDHRMAGRLWEETIVKLRSLSASTLRDLNPRKRKDKIKEIEQIEATLIEAEHHLGKIKAFLMPSNLRELAKLPVHRPNNRTNRTLAHFSKLAG